MQLISPWISNTSPFLYPEVRDFLLTVAVSSLQVDKYDGMSKLRLWGFWGRCS